MIDQAKVIVVGGPRIIYFDEMSLLTEEQMDYLMEQMGMSREELLDKLSKVVVEPVKSIHCQLLDAAELVSFFKPMECMEDVCRPKTVNPNSKSERWRRK